VTFLYPTDIEVRYIETLPEVGSHVTSSVGDAFVVEDVRPDGGGWVVVAVREGEERSIGSSAPSRSRRQ
jgi:hypothetical protein